MSKVLFISTPYENLGIEYMSAVLKTSRHQVDLIIDPCLFFNTYQRYQFFHGFFDYRSHIFKKIKKIKPDLICFSVMTDTYQWALDLARCIKGQTPVPIVFGGIHPTIAPDVVINEKQIDYVCVGEGEEAILELANRCLQPDDSKNIANIWAKNGTKVIKNDPRPEPSNLDNLPFPDKDLYYRESKIYSKEYFIMTSRGCNYNCAFCCNQVFLKIYGNKFLRRRSVNSIIEELSQSKKKYNFKFVWFMDDNFPGDIPWLKEFSQEYHRHIGLPFFCYANPNDMTDEVACLLKKANCHEVAMGVQSLNDKTCKLINRNTDRVNIKNSIESLRLNNIVSATENILGLPGEDENDILQLVDFYNNNRPDLIMFSWFKVFPGTSILSSLRNKKLINDNAVEAIVRGNDRSLASGGNYANVKKFNRAACLLVLVPFLPKSLVNFLLRTKLYKCFVFLSPTFLLRVLRLYKTTKLAMFMTGKKTYDVGAKVSLRIYRFFIADKFRWIS